MASLTVLCLLWKQFVSRWFSHIPHVIKDCFCQLCICLVGTKGLSDQSKIWIQCIVWDWTFFFNALIIRKSHQCASCLSGKWESKCSEDWSSCALGSDSQLPKGQFLKSLLSLGGKHQGSRDVRGLSARKKSKSKIVLPLCFQTISKRSVKIFHVIISIGGVSVPSVSLLSEFSLLI